MALADVNDPSDLATLSYAELDELAGEIRDFVVAAVAENAGHLGSNLGAVELTLALHRVFRSPHGAIRDTGHQAYVHKLVTGRRYRFGSLRRTDGLSGYPSSDEMRTTSSPLACLDRSLRHGLAVARDAGIADHRHWSRSSATARSPAMAYEALNNLGHSGKRVIIVLNDNGRSYAPTISTSPTSGPPPACETGSETAPVIARIGDWMRGRSPTSA